VRFFILIPQVLNTKGAARRLGCSETRIHKLAATGKLKAYTYGEEGELIEQTKDVRKRRAERRSGYHRN